MNRSRWTVCVAVLLLGLGAGRGDAQILNTLRGFDEAEHGWSGRIEATVAAADGNTEYFEVDARAMAQYRAARHRVQLRGRHMRRTAQGRETAESQVGHLRHNFRIRPWLSTVAFVQVQHDPFRRIRSRFLVGGGARFDLARSGALRAALGATVMREEETLTDGGGTTVTPRLSFFASAYRDVEEGVDLDLTAFYQPALDDLGDARAVASAGLRADIVGNLYFLLNYNLEYDSSPPPDVGRTDHAARSGLGFRL